MTSRDEAVGTLLVHQSDMKELSQASPREADEAVGTLLVHQSDMKELSSAEKPHLPEVNLTKRVTVGTLLVTPQDLESTPEEKQQEASIRRRITEALHKPPPDDGDDPVDQWRDHDELE
jgi:hypothetical protein